MLVNGLPGTGDQVTAAIRSASRTTGMTFDYLLNTAIRESSLDPAARAKTSSARGLYQFIESTWLAMVKEEGPKFGLGQFAAAIERRADGQYSVKDPRARAQILKLREDPVVSSVMAGALASRNSAELSSALGRKPTAGELYIAHFLGAGGAKRLIALQQNNPNASAAAAFPDAARANKSIFHRADGKARSAGEVFAALTGRHDTAPVRNAPAALRVLRICGRRSPPIPFRCPCATDLRRAWPTPIRSRPVIRPSPPKKVRHFRRCSGTTRSRTVRCRRPCANCGDRKRGLRAGEDCSECAGRDRRAPRSARSFARQPAACRAAHEAGQLRPVDGLQSLTNCQKSG
jgi:hypothetical protein